MMWITDHFHIFAGCTVLCMFAVIIYFAVDAYKIWPLGKEK